MRKEIKIYKTKERTPNVGQDVIFYVKGVGWIKGSYWRDADPYFYYFQSNSPCSDDYSEEEVTRWKPVN